MKKKLVNILGMVMVTAAMLTGCGADDTASGETSKTISKATDISAQTDISEDKSTGNKAESTVINEDVYSSYVCWTEAGLTRIELLEHSQSGMYVYKCEEDTLMMKNTLIEKYNSISMSGNNVILEKEDGTKVVFEYDEEAETLTADGYCFYGNNRDFTKKLQETEEIVEGSYTATLEGGYSVGPRQYKRGTYTVEAQFSADATVTAIIRNERYFYYRYYIKDDTVLYIDEDGGYKIGYYDKENDIITMNLDELVFTRQ